MPKTEADLFELVRADLAIQLEDDVTKLAESEAIRSNVRQSSTRSNGFLACPFESNSQICYSKT
jgi:hypothetical protein